MKCSALKQGDLALAYENALRDVGGREQNLTMDVLAPHLQETGSSCGACPALYTLARKAFEARQPTETTADVVRSSLAEVVPDLKSFIPRGA